MTPGDPQFNPFPGLRPFDMDEEYLFFGRENQRKELIALLREQRFIAVLGTSGSGKSSLVRAGLLPALCGGVMTRAGSNWHIAVMRPGGRPVSNLAAVLHETGLLDNPGCEDLTELDIEATLIRSGLGLIEAARQLGLKQNENLLIVVDQFEELFRFNSSQSERGSRDEAASFVKILVEAARQQELSVYVVLTMRSDFFGDCSQFEELAEAVNKGEYLVPRLNRENKKIAIDGPVRVGGGEIAPRLVQRLLNDLGDDPDQLPILQHALMRTWDHWLADHKEGEPLDLRHYEATGGMAQALSRHADEVLAEAGSEEEKELTRRLFQALTEKGPDNRGIRRPTSIDELCAITAADKGDVIAIIDRYRKPGRTFLMPPVEIELAADTVIDISHESLMRVWENLGRWVDDEAQSARIYRRLAETAQLHADDRAGLYRDPDLQIALSWQENENPTEPWGKRYHGDYAQAIRFLEKSHEIKLEKERQNETARERELEQAKRLAKAEQENAANQQKLAVVQKRRARLALAVAALAIISTAFAAFAWQKAKESEELARKSEERAILSLVNRQELRKEDVEKAFEIISQEENGAARFAQSMRRAASERIRFDDYQSAKVAIDAANKADPNNYGAWLNSGLIHLELGETEKAIRDVKEFAKLAEQRQGDNSMGFQASWALGAMIIAKCGDNASYQEICKSILNTYPGPGGLIPKVYFAMKPNDEETLKDGHRHALDFVDRGFQFNNWALFHAGLAEFRIGNLDSAMDYARRSLSARHNSAAHELSLKALNNSLLSLIYYQLNDLPKSASTLETAKFNQAEFRKLKTALHDLYLAELLLEERESLDSKQSSE